MDIIQRIENIDGLRFVGGCSEEQLTEAENALGLKFPTEYALYIREYGCIGFGSTEWTGLNVKGRLNVVDATKREKELNKAFLEKCFLLDNWCIDGKMAIMHEDGRIYLLQNKSVTPLCNTLGEYLEMCVSNYQ